MLNLLKNACLSLLLVAPGCAPPGPGASNDGTDESGTTGPSSTADESGTTNPSSTADESGTTGPSSTNCGNGIIDPGETCDDEGESPTCNADCTEVACGDLHVNAAAGEECDGLDLAGATCQTLGFGDGTLSCGEGCSYDASGCSNPPAAPVLSLGFSPIKQFDFSWAAAAEADYYRLEESIAPGEPFVQLGGNIVGESISLTMPLYLRFEASYRLWACNDDGCTSSTVVEVMSSLAEAVGYIKASNTAASDYFGTSVALSGDGNTLAVGAFGEDSNASGINGDQANDAAEASGAVYVFVRYGMDTWSQQAYLKASNPDPVDSFGWSVALSDDGNTLAVGAHREESDATGIGGDQANDAVPYAGAVYVFTRDGRGTWSQQAYVKASNTGEDDFFGTSVALSGDGNTLAVGAYGEDSNASGIDGDQANDAVGDSGAVYVFVRDGMSGWSQQAYVKASNPGSTDLFGLCLALSGDGNTLAVGALYEDSNASGIDGDQANDAVGGSGAVYVFVRDGMSAWSQQAYVKASNPGSGDAFGVGVALSGDGNTLAVGAFGEDSSAPGIDGDQANDTAGDAGAVYVFVRDDMDVWSQQAYVKASNPDHDDFFGFSMALSGDGNALAVSAYHEGSNATGIDGNQAFDAFTGAGAVYVFVRDGMGVWSQQAYVKASNTGDGDSFGSGGVALSNDANVLAVGAYLESSNATGIDGDQANDAAFAAGAVYLY